MQDQIIPLDELRDDVQATQRLIAQTILQDDVDSGEWGFIEKKLNMISSQLIRQVQQQPLVDLDESEHRTLKLIHRYYTEMVESVTTKKRSVSEELHNLGNRQRLSNAYKK